MIATISHSLVVRPIKSVCSTTYTAGAAVGNRITQLVSAIFRSIGKVFEFFLDKLSPTYTLNKKFDALSNKVEAMKTQKPEPPKPPIEESLSKIVTAAVRQEMQVLKETNKASKQPDVEQNPMFAQLNGVLAAITGENKQQVKAIDELKEAIGTLKQSFTSLAATKQQVAPLPPQIDPNQIVEMVTHLEHLKTNLHTLSTSISTNTGQQNHDLQKLTTDYQKLWTLLNQSNANHEQQTKVIAEQLGALQNQQNETSAKQSKQTEVAQHESVGLLNQIKATIEQFSTLQQKHSQFLSVISERNEKVETQIQKHFEMVDSRAVNLSNQTSAANEQLLNTFQLQQNHLLSVISGNNEKVETQIKKHFETADGKAVNLLNQTNAIIEQHLNAIQQQQNEASKRQNKLEVQIQKHFETARQDSLNSSNQVSAANEQLLNTFRQQQKQLLSTTSEMSEKFEAQILQHLETVRNDSMSSSNQTNAATKQLLNAFQQQQKQALSETNEQIEAQMRQNLEMVNQSISNIFTQMRSRFDQSHIQTLEAFNERVNQLSDKLNESLEPVLSNQNKNSELILSQINDQSNNLNKEMDQMRVALTTDSRAVVDNLMKALGTHQEYYTTHFDDLKEQVEHLPIEIEKSEKLILDRVSQVEVPLNKMANDLVTARDSLGQEIAACRSQIVSNSEALTKITQPGVVLESALHLANTSKDYLKECNKMVTAQEGREDNERVDQLIKKGEEYLVLLDNLTAEIRETLRNSGFAANLNPNLNEPNSVEERLMETQVELASTKDDLEQTLIVAKKRLDETNDLKKKNQKLEITLKESVNANQELQQKWDTALDSKKTARELKKLGDEVKKFDKENKELRNQITALITKSQKLENNENGGNRAGNGADKPPGKIFSAARRASSGSFSNG